MQQKEQQITHSEIYAIESSASASAVESSTCASAFESSACASAVKISACASAVASSFESAGCASATLECGRVLKGLDINCQLLMIEFLKLWGPLGASGSL